MNIEHFRPLQAASASVNVKDYRKAMLNIWEDFAEEKKCLEEMHCVTMNIMEDFAGEKTRLEETQRAMLNLLDDFNKEREKTEAVNRELRAAEEALIKLNKELELRVKKRTAELESLNQALRESEKRYRQIVETATEGIWVIDRTYRIIFANKKMAEMLACTAEELIGKSFFDFIDFEWTAEAENILTCYQQVKAELQEIKFRRTDGQELWGILSANPFLELNGQHFGSLLMVTNITKHKQFEKEMARLDRLKLVGEMAASIAHEIRNPMTTVRGFLQLLNNRGEYAENKSHFSVMIDELDRANSIVTEYLLLARNKMIVKKQTNLNNILKNMLPLIQADAMESDKYVTAEFGEITDLLLDEKEIRQVILNLVRNGLEASPPGSELTIRTFSDGEEVVLAVQDNGIGISSNVFDKIGTPFFTTKENGTGLGLAVCYSIAARHNAKIEIETELNGTTFLVRFKQLAQPNTESQEVQTVVHSRG